MKMNEATCKLADQILASKRRANHPCSTGEPDKRLVGWIMDADVVGLSEGLFAIEEIERRAMAVAPAQREPAAFQFRQRSGIGKGPQCSLPWGDWCEIGRETYDRYLQQPNKLVQVRALYADVPAERTPDWRAMDRVEEAAEAAFKILSPGLPYTPEDAFWYRQVVHAVLERCSPAASAEREPNAETIAVLEEASAGGGEVFTGSTADAFRSPAATYTEGQVSAAVEKVISQMLASGELARPSQPETSSKPEPRG